MEEQIKKILFEDTETPQQAPTSLEAPATVTLSQPQEMTSKQGETPSHDSDGTTSQKRQQKDRKKHTPQQAPLGVLPKDVILAAFKETIKKSVFNSLNITLGTEQKQLRREIAAIVDV